MAKRDQRRAAVQESVRVSQHKAVRPFGYNEVARALENYAVQRSGLCRLRMDTAIRLHRCGTLEHAARGPHQRGFDRVLEGSYQARKYDLNSWRVCLQSHIDGLPRAGCRAEKRKRNRVRFVGRRREHENINDIALHVVPQAQNVAVVCSVVDNKSQATPGVRRKRPHREPRQGEKLLDGTGLFARSPSKDRECVSRRQRPGQ